MKTIYTIFPLCENVHLVKDVGMIPYYFNKKYGYKSVIVTYKNGDYPYLETEVKGLELFFLKRITGIPTIDVIFFLIFNSSNIDILNCFHFMKSTRLFIFFFRLFTLFNIKKKVYLKLDANIDFTEIIPITFFEKFIIKQINLISVENKLFYKKMLKIKIFQKTNLIYLPNGFSKDQLKIIDFDLKENIILTVGRIGSKQKANHILLESFAQFCKLNNDWQLYLVGPVENTFNDYIETFFSSYPQLKNKIHFTGAIYDREKLDSYYSKAKLFILTSKYEGFPLVFLEALKNGCTILSTNFPSAYDITCKQKLGSIFNQGDTKELTNILNDYISNPNELAYNCDANQKYANDNFDWNILIKKIHNELF